MEVQEEVVNPQDLEVVTLVNRTTDTVTWMWDGREYSLKGLAEKPFKLEVAKHGRAKTKYGFENGAWKYRLGIKEFKHDCDPIEDADAPDQFIDLMHRKDDKSVELRRFSNPELAKGANLGSDF